MAKIEIKTTKKEQQQVLQVIKQCEGKTISVASIARLAELNPNRVRFIIMDLIENNKIKRIPTKAFNKRYIRYKYEIIESEP